MHENKYTLIIKLNLTIVLLYFPEKWLRMLHKKRFAYLYIVLIYGRTMDCRIRQLASRLYSACKFRLGTLVTP